MKFEQKTFYICIKPEYEAQLFSKIVMDSYWHLNLNSAKANLSRGDAGVMSITLAYPINPGLVTGQEIV
jgi:hypothetical protein